MLQMFASPPTRLHERVAPWVKRQLASARQAGRLLAAAVLAIALLAAGGYAWVRQSSPALPADFAKTNGRIEAERVDIATKYAGRLQDVLVKEGDRVQAGEVVARMDTAELEAQLREAEAAVRQAEQQQIQAQAILAQRQSELALAEIELSRALQLGSKGYAPQERVDQRRATKLTAEAAVNSANAQIALAAAMVESANARVQRIKTQLDDAALKTPRAGRVQYRLALPGEVLPAGGKVLTVLDLTDVYMTIFLPTREAGRLRLGSEARIVFDAAPQYVVPAYVTFVAAEAQFTPKYVETQNEREKLMFRVKIQLPPEILQRYADLVKTGVPGVAYVRLNPDVQWPPSLGVRLPG